MIRRPIMLLWMMFLCVLCLSSFSPIGQTSAAAHPNSGSEQAPVRHVLLLSIDGFHALDLARYVRLNHASALAALSAIGVTYANAAASKPSDSFPGLLAMVTGGTPATTGVYYDDSYDRSLSPPGSNCSTVGTEVVYDESIDLNPDALDAGGGIDPTLLPLDPAKGCTPVYPHSFLRVNTVFEVIKAAGGRTAWSDKHPSYDLVNGPSGTGVDDLYTPEIAAGGTTNSIALTEAYDDLKVQALLKEIAGQDHTGATTVGVPAIFGMNFQAVSVAQKLAGNGYTDASGTPSAGLLDALNHTDQSIGKLVRALRDDHLLRSTLIIVTAKHGQSPIDPSKHQIVNKNIIPNLVAAVQPGLLAQATQDDVALLWLTDQSKTDAVAAELAANQAQAHIQQIFSGDTLKRLFDDPLADPRTPDIAVQPELGVIYTKITATKIAEHGGFSEEDTHVALLVANPRLGHDEVKAEVQTTQIAPTILKALGLDANKLRAVQIEKTQSLPGLDLDADS